MRVTGMRNENDHWSMVLENEIWSTEILLSRSQDVLKSSTSLPSLLTFLILKQLQHNA